MAASRKAGEEYCDSGWAAEELVDKLLGLLLLRHVKLWVPSWVSEQQAAKYASCA